MGTIGLIYLPATLVLVSLKAASLTSSPRLSLIKNFFSTEFVLPTPTGGIRISSSVWLLGAVSIPLTLVTLGAWLAWLKSRCPAAATKKRNSRLSGGRLWASFFRKKTREDLENGVGSPKIKCVNTFRSDSFPHITYGHRTSTTTTDSTKIGQPYAKVESFNA